MEHGRLAGIYIPAAWKNENFSRTACLWSYDMPNARINVRITVPGQIHRLGKIEGIPVVVESNIGTGTIITIRHQAVKVESGSTGRSP